VENEPEKVEGRKRLDSCLFLFVEFSCEPPVLASVWYVTHGISSFSMEREIWLFLLVDMCIIKERYEGKFSLFLTGNVSCILVTGVFTGNQRPEKVSRQSVRRFPLFHPAHVVVNMIVETGFVQSSVCVCTNRLIEMKLGCIIVR